MQAIKRKILRNHPGATAALVLPAAALLAVWTGAWLAVWLAARADPLVSPGRSGDIGIARTSSSAALEGGEYWDEGFINEDVGGPIRAIAVKGADVYVAGEFATAGGVPAHNIAKWDGQNWSALGDGVTNDDPYYPAIVDEILISGDNIYISGRFSHAGGRAVNNVARWNGSRWNALGAGLAYEDEYANPRVRALAERDGIIYAGGAFDMAGGIPAVSIAKWDGASWSSFSARITSAGVAPIVNDIAFWKDKICCGTSGGMYEWNGSSWKADGPSGNVYALAANDSLLFAGGYFPRLDGMGTSSFACWDGTAWRALGEYGGVAGRVYALGIWENDLFVGGDYTIAGGLSANYIRRWDGTRWHRLGDSSDNGTNGAVLGMAPCEAGMYIAGAFTAAGGKDAGSIALWNGEELLPVYQGSNNSVNNTVTAIAATPKKVYLGGRFTRAGEVQAISAATWDGAGWMRMQSGISRLYESYPYVNAFAERNDTVYTGGIFTHAGGQHAAGLAFWDGSEWREWGGGAWMRDFYSTQYVEGNVYAIAQAGGMLYVGGYFHRLGLSEMIHIGKWNGRAWESPAGGISAPSGGGIRALAFGGDTLYAAGRFNAAGGVPAFNIAGWNDSIWFPLGDGLDGEVHALASDGKSLFAGGEFMNAGGIETRYVAGWDGSSWHALGNGLNGDVLALEVIGEYLCAAGMFTMAGDTPVNHIALWDGVEWKPMGSGLDQPGRALEAREYELFVGGEFLSAGSKPSNYFARWFLPGTLAVRSFSAEGGPDGVALEWDFFSNVEMAGIAVRRRESGTQTEITATGDRLLDPSVRRYLDAGAHPGKTYEYVLALLRADSSEVVSDAVEATMPVPPLALRQNCPNPFRKNTSIEFSLSRRSRVILGIYDIQGGLVAIVRDRIYEPGIWREEWDGTDRRGRPAGSGIYFYRFEAEGRILARKMLLLR